MLCQETSRVLQGGRLHLRHPCRSLCRSLQPNALHGQPDIDLETLAAAYAFGLAQNHPFHDGNKRVAFVTMVVFLELNGRRFEADEADVVKTMMSLAAGELSERRLATWIRKNSTS